MKTSINKNWPRNEKQNHLDERSPMDFQSEREKWNAKFRLVTGAGLDKGDAVLTLRDRLLREKNAPDKLPPGYIMCFVIKAWNAYITRTELRSLKIISTQKFPKIAGHA